MLELQIELGMITYFTKTLHDFLIIDIIKNNVYAMCK